MVQLHLPGRSTYGRYEIRRFLLVAASPEWLKYACMSPLNKQKIMVIIGGKMYRVLSRNESQSPPHFPRLFWLANLWTEDS